jgi:transposase
VLGELERLSEQGEIDLVYADAARVSMSAVVPYGWQFADEDVFMPSTPGAGINCFALLTRTNQCRFATTRHSITSQFVLEQVEHLSMALRKLTVLVLDNASVHTSKLIQTRRAAWEARGLFVLYLPRTAPHLNIVETLWRKLKYEWLTPKAYETMDGLCYTVRQALAAVGTSLWINFSTFSLS